MNEQKKAFSSGKISGTRTLLSDLESVENRDEIEQFLLDFLSIKFEYRTDCQIIYINDDQDFIEHMEEIEQNEFVSIYPTANFNRLYITTDNKTIYIIRINKVTSALIATFVAKEKPIKIALNSFLFIRWCNEKNIDARNIYDIPTYIKLLTNNVDPYKTINDYIKEYTTYELSEDDNEANSIIIGNFIYTFGKFLMKYIKKFKLENTSKLITENTYFEVTPIEENGNCKIVASYTNINEIILTNNDIGNRQYVISPLNRIATKFGYTKQSILNELYNEDISIIVLNSLYNNNIPVKINENGEYIITCRYKNFSNILNIVTAILTDTFYSTFHQAPELKINCTIKE